MYVSCLGVFYDILMIKRPVNIYRPLLLHVSALQTKPLTVFRQLGFDLWQGFAGGFFAQFDGLVALVKAANGT